MTHSTASRPLATVLAVVIMASSWMATLAGPAQDTAPTQSLVALSATASSPILM
jgi:hypothetical protein